MKRKAILMFAALSVAIGAAAGSRMATEEWVRRYVGASGTNGVFATESWVSNYVDAVIALIDSGVTVSASTNGYLMTYGDVRLFVEYQTEFCMAVVEQTALSASYGYTNDVVFAKDPANPRIYRNGDLTIHITPTNFYTVAGGNIYRSVEIGKSRWLAGVAGGVTNRFCKLGRTYLGPSQVAKVLAGEPFLPSDDDEDEMEIGRVGL